MQPRPALTTTTMEKSQMAKKPIPTPAELRQLLRYDAKTGKLIWRARTPEMFPSGQRSQEWLCKAFNTKSAGKIAGHFDASHGYEKVTIWGVDYKSHRVIWAMLRDEWPEIIDHVDGRRDNNRIENLRNVTISENNMNVGVRKDNSSGEPNVYAKREKWQVSISKFGKTYNLGTFSDKAEAIAIARQARRDLGFANLHGCARPRA